MRLLQLISRLLLACQGSAGCPLAVGSRCARILPGVLEGELLGESWKTMRTGIRSDRVRNDETKLTRNFPQNNTKLTPYL